MPTLDAIPDLVNAACSGDCVAAARAAMLLHSRSGAEPSVTHLSSDQLVTMALGSDDPEFLVELGDALCAGEILPARPSLARACYERADRISPFMGAYALGMSRGLIDPRASLGYLRKAASNGHWASQTMLFWIDMPQGWLRRMLWRWQFKLRQIPTISKVVRGQRQGAFLWRYRDIIPSDKTGVYRMLGPDRKVQLTLDRSPPQPAAGELFSERRADASTLKGSTKRFYVYFPHEMIREALSVRHKLLCSLPPGCLVHALEKGRRGLHPLPKFEIACPDSLYEDARRIIDAERGSLSVLCSDSRSRIEDELRDRENWLGEVPWSEVR